MSKIPIDLQQLICCYAIGNEGLDPFFSTAITVNKTWAYIACNVLYRDYKFKDYIAFVNFVRTVTKKKPILPYAFFVRSTDLTPVNKYGIDKRGYELIRACPYLNHVRMGHPTTLKPETIQRIANRNFRLRSFSVGAIDSSPFMLTCDFSKLTSLEHASFETTPLLYSSIATLPPHLKSIEWIQMDAITPQNLLDFCSSHPKLSSLVIVQCRSLLTDALAPVLAEVLLNFKQLNHIELIGSLVTDSFLACFLEHIAPREEPARLILRHTSITSSQPLLKPHYLPLQIKII